MSLELVTPPAQEPIGLPEAKSHLVVEHTGDDKLIGRLLTAARQWVEAVLWRQLLTATYALHLHRFPCGALYLPRPKLQAANSIQYVDPQGAAQTWSAGERQVDLYSEPGIVLPAYGYSWPATRCQLNAVTVNFDCGYGDEPADVPEPIRSAILDLVAHWYENRQPVVTGTIAADLKMMVMAKLEPYKFRDDRVLEFV